MSASAPLPAYETAPESLEAPSALPLPATPVAPHSRARQAWNLVRRGPGSYLILFKALGLVIVVRLGLTFWSYKGLREHLPRFFRRAQGRLEPEAAFGEAQRVVWAVSRAASLVPDASCLTQAFATQMMLARRGEASRLHVGVAKHPETGKFEAHAWVEHRERVIIGGPRYMIARYSPIAAFDV